MPFLNRVRLPISVRQPQFPMERAVFRKSNGVTKVLSVVIRNTWQGVTDHMPKDFHEKLVIALSHDTVNIEGQKLFTGVNLDGDYQINWQDFLDYPLAQAQFQLNVTPYNETNDNCQTCEEATQLALEDDTFVYPLENGEEATIDVFANDDICCSPITAVIMWADPLILNDATIDQETGILTVFVKDYLVFGTGVPVKLATYRVTCPNGGYDEADVYGEIAGDPPDCAPPSDLVFDGVDSITFTPSPSSPGDGYDYAIYTCDNLGTPVYTGNNAGSPIDLSAAGLIPGQCYVIVVASVCTQDLVYSTTATLEFTMPNTIGDNCGRFTLLNLDPFGSVPILEVTYMDCNGDLQNIIVNEAKIICALRNLVSGTYYYIEAAAGSLGITDNGPCV